MRNRSGLLIAGCIAACFTVSAHAQTAPTTAADPAPTSSATAPPSQPTVEVPAGTKVLLALKSGINTKTAQAGDPVYLTSSFPVVAKNRVMIPAGAYVQGVVDKVVRPGRVKGRAEVTMHFTTIIFPNQTVVEIPGTVDSIPGSSGPKVKGSEGTIEQAGSQGKDLGKVATGAATGAGVGTIAGAAAGHPMAGLGYGALTGAAAGALYTLFTRGDDVVLEPGQTVEMVLQRPLELTEANLTKPDGSEVLTPVPGQSKMLPKPQKNQLLCPQGTLGCN